MGDLRVLVELEVLQALGEREPGVDQPAAFAALSALCDLRFQERGEIRGRGLLVACGLLGEPTEACPDGREVQLAGVRVDQCFHRLDLRRGTHRLAPAASSWS